MEPIEALKRFLLDIKTLEKLSQKSNFNPFDVLKIARTEIRHSNMLAWLLDPNENHGLGTRIISSLIEFVVHNNFLDNDTSFRLLLHSKEDVTIKREWKNIDILIESISGKFVICIENKIDTQDHSSQLKKYYDIIEEDKKYRDFAKVFLYLTPDGRLPIEDSTDIWEIISYPDIIEMIEAEMEKANLNDEAQLFINYYVDVLRRETMENNDLIAICQQIYKEHKQALDLIFEYRPDMLQDVNVFFDQWCKDMQAKGEIIYDEHKSNKSYHRFRTAKMDQIMTQTTTEKENSTWNTTNHYYYEIGAYMDKENVKFGIHFVVNSENLKPEQIQFLEQFCNNLNKNKKPKANWKFITPVTGNKGNKKFMVSPDDLASSDIEADIKKDLDAAWKYLREKVEGK